MTRGELLPDEYKLAHEELTAMWDLYWRQASFFLSFNGALMAFTSTSLSVLQNHHVVILVSMFGVLITVLWLFHSNRFFLYIREIEGKMREAEENEAFVIKLKTYQQAFYSQRKRLPFLERFSGSAIRNKALPLVTLAVWLLIIAYAVWQLLFA